MHSVNMHRLCRLYEAWCEKHKLPFISADELLLEAHTHSQRLWLQRFINAWERWA